MLLTELTHTGFRNLLPDTLKPDNEINLFIGPNGAGKSGLLEAVHLLATGKSFRVARNSAVVRWGAPGLSVHGRWSPSNSNAAVRPVALRVAGNVTEIRIAGTEVSRLDILRRFPIIFIGAESLRFFEDGPSFRRQQLDWGAFHVEQSYIQSWRRYRQALSQRNALLRLGTTAELLAPWERQMDASASAISGARETFFAALLVRFNELKPEFNLPHSLKLGYRPGWDPDAVLSPQLQAARATDMRLRYTSVGPHRDDLTLTANSRNALSALSRGEQKAFMLCFFISLREFTKGVTGDTPLLMIDDIGAEFDEARQAGVLGLLASLGGQSLVTAVSCPQSVPQAQTRMFHVEQGRISK